MKKILKVGIIVFLILAVICLGGLLIFLGNISNSVSLNDLDKSKLTVNYSNIPVYDASENRINEETNFVSVNELQDYTKDAFISIEDKDFYNHNGLNYKRIVMAMINNIKSGSFKEGASTISQQLVKNTQLSNDKTIERKIKEMYITQELEKEYSKNEILEMYLNNIYYGNSSYGIQNASKNYFGKDAKDLTLSESAVLAGLIKAPATYSPIYDLEKCTQRRNLVLSEMLKDKVITEEQYNDAINEEIILTTSVTKVINNNIYYDYMDIVMKEASEILGLSLDEINEGDYKIYTYLDKNKQEEVYNIINSEKYIIANRNGEICQGILNIVDNTNNSLVAFASNTDYEVGNLIRQPGSAIKPFMVYAPALEQGIINPMTKVLDEPIDIDGYKPKNVGNTYSGYVSVRDSIAYSLNIPAVKLLKEIGIDKAKEFATNCGIEFADSDNGYALALGGFTDGISIENLTNSYTVFANGGYYKPLSTIRKITNKHGVAIYLDNRYSSKVMGEDTAYLMTSILQDGVKYGTSKRLNKLNCDIAGKTGTVAVPNTNYNTDAISIAFTNDYSVGCWIGNYTLESSANLDGSNNGGTYATSVLNDTFVYLNNIKQPDSFKVPNSVEKCKINRVVYERDNSIVIADNDCSDRYIIEDYFSKRYLPSVSTQEEVVFNPSIEYDEDKNYITINFDPLPSYEYQIIKVVNNKEEIIIDTQSGIDGYNYTDYDIKSGNSYMYYIKYKSKEKLTYNISKKTNIIIPEKNNGSKNYDYKWLFS